MALVSKDNPTWEQLKDGLIDHLKSMSDSLRKLNALNGVDDSDKPFKSMADFWLKEATVFKHEPLTPEEEDKVWSFVGGGLYRTKECFQNAQTLITYNGFLRPNTLSGKLVKGVLGDPEEKGFSYAEGVGLSNGVFFPIDHAWLTLNGKPIDVTWTSTEERGPDGWPKRPSRSKKRVMDRIRRNIERSVYMGIEIPTKYVVEHLLRVERYSMIVEGDYDYPWLVAGGLPWRKGDG